MENSDLLIEKMKQQNLKPKPKWYFTARGNLIWITFFLFMLLGAIAFSILLFSIQQLDFHLMSHMTHSKTEFVLGLIPFFWLVSLIVSLSIAMVGIRSSKKGYKFSFLNTIFFSLVFSILFGALFFIGGGAEYLEDKFSAHVEIYEGIQAKKMNTWSNPEEGYLGGTIHEVDDYSIVLVDFNNIHWTIQMEKAKIPSVVVLEVGEQIKVIGRKTSKHEFKAEEVRPWGGFGAKRKNRRGQRNK